jgi:multimeric flavodoxin WrbA
MKVLGIVGSPRHGGNTEILIRETLQTISLDGIEVETVLLADKKINPCNACLLCKEKKNFCAIEDDLTPILEKIKMTDGLILGSPVYFGSATPNIKALIDRVGYVFRNGENFLERKVGAPLVVARRAGHNFTFAQLLYFFFIMGMIIPGSTYWSIAFGREKGSVLQDEEGISTARKLGENIAWLLRKIR